MVQFILVSANEKNTSQSQALTKEANCLFVVKHIFHQLWLAATLRMVCFSSETQRLTHLLQSAGIIG